MRPRRIRLSSKHSAVSHFFHYSICSTLFSLSLNRVRWGAGGETQSGRWRHGKRAERCWAYVLSRCLEGVCKKIWENDFFILMNALEIMWWIGLGTAHIAFFGKCLPKLFTNNRKMVYIRNTPVPYSDGIFRQLGQSSTRKETVWLSMNESKLVMQRIMFYGLFLSRIITNKSNFSNFQGGVGTRQVPQWEWIKSY